VPEGEDCGRAACRAGRAGKILVGFDPAPTRGFEAVEETGGRGSACDRSKRLTDLHAFSTREGESSEGPFASLNLGRSVGDDPERVAENARRFAGGLGLTAGQLVSANQVHGETIVEVAGARPGPEVPRAVADADGLVTRARGVALGIRTADCVRSSSTRRTSGRSPRSTPAGAGRGWASPAGRSPVKGSLRADPRRMVAAIGPHIRSAATRWA
jgi:hypothetical protein